LRFKLRPGPLEKKLSSVIELIQHLESVNKKMEDEYDDSLLKIREKSIPAAQLVKKIKEICDLIPKFEKLRENHSFLNELEGTDAFRLVVKEKELISNIFIELEEIKTKHIQLSIDIETQYSELYKRNGKFKIRQLNNEAKKLDNATIKLNIFNGSISTLNLHDFLFGSIAVFIHKANNLYTNYYPIWLDFSRIKLSSEELSIKAYNPVLDKKFTDDFRQKTLSNFSEEEKTKSKLVLIEETNLIDNDGINPEDVNQGALGDCYFLSGVESLARFDKKKIFGDKDSIISSPDEDGNYTVKLFVPDNTSDNGMKKVFIKVKPTFVNKQIITKNNKQIKTSSDPDFIKLKPTPLFADDGDDKMWVQLLEKALAELEGSYGEIAGDKIDINLTGLEMLTGVRSTSYSLPEKIDEILNQLVTDYTTNNKIPMAKFSTKHNLPNLSSENTAESGEKYTFYRPDIRIYAQHAYSLVNIINVTKNNEVLQLKNPHNNNIKVKGKEIGGGKLIEVTRDELIEYFSSIEIN
jgi:hypothetical protein